MTGRGKEAGTGPKVPGFVATSLASIYLACLPIVDFFAGSRGRTLPILSFHRISDYRPEHWMTVLPDRFASLMRALQRRYDFVSLQEIDEILARGDKVRNLVGLTFDDAYGCNYAHALPVLKALKIPATFFVSTAHIDTPKPFQHDVARDMNDLPNFTSQQIRAIASDPSYEIGSHTISHIDFSRPTGESEIVRELRDSKLELERITGRPVRRLGVPFGGIDHCNSDVLRIARQVGYERVYSFFGGRNLVLENGHVGYVLQRVCPEYDTPMYARACLEGYRGRRSFTPGRTDRSRWPAEIHPCELRLL